MSKKIDQEEELRIKKAEIELLEQAKVTIKKHYGDNNDKRVQKLFEGIDEAIESNYQTAEVQLMAKRSEIDNIEYREGGSKHLTMDKHKEQLESGNIKTENDELYGIEAGNMIELEDEEEITLDLSDEEMGREESYDITYSNSARRKLDEVEEVDIYDTSYLDKSYTDFDFKSIGHTNFDMIPLPSKGECYPHKRSKIPVGYLTASDENIVLSPNLYRDGKVVDVLLRRKILDPTIKVEELCVADKDAILLFLRANGYGVELPLTVIDPKDGNQHKVKVDLTKFKAREFTLKGDENGWFDYTTSNGDKIKFNFLTHAQDNFISKEYAKEIELQSNISIRESVEFVGEKIRQTKVSNENVKKAYVILDKWSKDLDNSENEYYVSEALTLSTFYMIREVNGNRDRAFIKNYVNNMRVMESKKFREYVSEHVPMIDFQFEVKRPRRGGSFKTFLEFSHYILLNT